MSIEQAQAFIEKVKNDEDLAKKLADAPDIESRLLIARQEGFEFTVEEINKADEILSDEVLDSVAGGGHICFQHMIS